MLPANTRDAAPVRPATVRVHPKDVVTMSSGSPGSENPIRFSEEHSAEVVEASFANTPDPRLRQLITSLVQHLHAFAKEVDLTQAELEAAVDFLTRTGQACTDVRQEFMMLSDVLGLSMLVDEISHRGPAGATEPTVLGPFHMVDSPPRALGDTISLAPGGEPTLVTGQVLSVEGHELAGALVDVWQADENGFYDVQEPQTVPQGNLRGLFTCDEQGRFAFRTIMPAPYPVPCDGPVGELLEATDRLPYRPAHIHFIARAEGYATLTTHMFVAGSPYLDSDAVFAVKDSLVRDFPLIEDAELADRYGMATPFRHAHVEIRLWKSS
ncbi:dioxygenase [Nonomuraea sp. NPDC049784]|uniref:dioxygenase family protein n=1 Tax=Nonomuraea sp. NPDC049784 TaxID=3154361 RepID=UPI0033FBE693